jgi:hypothetical protein
LTSADHLLLYGATEPLPERIALNAGPFTLAFEAGDIRYISIGDREVVRRIYGAVRHHRVRFRRVGPLDALLVARAPALAQTRRARSAATRPSTHAIRQMSLGVPF